MSNYFCTWSVQNYQYGCGADRLDPAELEGARGAAHARESMNQRQILGTDGWARRFHPRARGGLYFLLDDGWDVPDPVDDAWFGSLILNADRFPDAPKEPWERLAWLNRELKALGWRGLGLWVAAQEAPALGGGIMTGAEQERYWAERLEWSERAGVEYWKVDWGAHAAEPEFRANLTRWARRIAPHLTIEHALCRGPINDGPDGRLPAEDARKEAALLETADVVRTYDILQPLSAAQTMERVAALLAAAQARSAGRARLDCGNGYCSAAGREGSADRARPDREDERSAEGRKSTADCAQFNCEDECRSAAGEDRPAGCARLGCEDERCSAAGQEGSADRAQFNCEDMRSSAAVQGGSFTSRALINCEDECYLAAALGLCAGVMRHPLRGLRPGGDLDWAFPETADNAKRRMDEAARMVRWQELMPPFGAMDEPVEIDARLLEDEHFFLPGETWLAAQIGKSLVQRAPARISRGMALPEIRCDGEPPFAAAACHGDCAAAALLPRTVKGRFMPLAELELALPHPVTHLAVFGRCRSLRVSGLGQCRAVARDLLGGEAVPVEVRDGVLALSGAQACAIGLSAAAPGDLSEPGILITLEEV